jgi:hypothetical protein
MAGVGKQIIGSFEDIGKDIIRETVQAPTDIAGKALESLGTASQKGQRGNPVPQVKPETGKPPERQISARQWLAQLAGKSKKPQEPTVQERLEKEKQEENEKEAKQTAVAQKMAPLPPMSQKPKPGNLYGIPQKSSSEKSKNVRQD